MEVVDVASASTSGLASALERLEDGKDIFGNYQPLVTPPGSACGSIDIPERGVRNRWRKRAAGVFAFECWHAVCCVYTVRLESAYFVEVDWSAAGSHCEGYGRRAIPEQD